MSSDDEDPILRFHRHRQTGVPRYNRHRRSSSPSPTTPHFYVTEAPSLPPLYRLSMALLDRFKKPNPRFLSFLLQSLIMILVIAVFFLFMGFAAVFLVHICVVSRTLHRTRTRPVSHVSRFSYSVHENDLDYFDSTGLSPLDIQKLPLFDYRMVLKSAPTTRDCAVCLEGFREGDERYRILPRCKHAYHANCIDPWLIKASICPICRGVVELDDD